MAKKSRDRTWPPAPDPLPSPVVDNHTHLDFAPELPDAPAILPGGFDGRDADGVAAQPPRELSLEKQISLAAGVGVDRIVQCGCELPAARWTTDVVGQYPALLGAIAIHPNEATLHATPQYPSGAHDLGPDGLAPRRAKHHAISLDDAIAEIAALAKSQPRIRAIGETGLDYFRTGEQGAAVQREAFRAHIAIAKELDLALQIHDRSAPGSTASHDDVIAILLADGAPARTVFHCFSGDAAMADVCAANGWYLSFAGPVTYRANEELREALRRTPLNLVLVETDAPFLTPHPYRGHPNAPYVMGYTVWAMAETLLRPITEVCQALSDNAERVYGSWH